MTYIILFEIALLIFIFLFYFPKAKQWWENPTKFYCVCSKCGYKSRRWFDNCLRCGKRFGYYESDEL